LKGITNRTLTESRNSHRGQEFRATVSSVGALKNPFNDIELVGQVLRRQGFDVLPEMKDARRTAILGGVRELVRQLNARRVYLTGRPVADPAALKRVEAERAWERVKDSRSPAVLERFITQFPETVFAALARERFNELQVEARASAIVREQERQGLAMLEM